MKRTKEDIQKEIAKLERIEHGRAMQDHWTADDYEYSRKNCMRLSELAKELEAIH